MNFIGRMLDFRGPTPPALYESKTNPNEYFVSPDLEGKIKAVLKSRQKYQEASQREAYLKPNEFGTKVVNRAEKNFSKAEKALKKAEKAALSTLKAQFKGVSPEALKSTMGKIEKAVEEKEIEMEIASPGGDVNRRIQTVSSTVLSKIYSDLPSDEAKKKRLQERSTELSFQSTQELKLQGPQLKSFLEDTFRAAPDAYLSKILEERPEFPLAPVTVELKELPPPSSRSGSLTSSEADSIEDTSVPGNSMELKEIKKPEDKT